VDVKSQWVILDLKNRKITEADDQMMQKFGNPYLKHMPRFKRLRPLKAYSSSKKYTVRYYDLDTNHHLTNSIYFDWMIDTLPREFLNSHTVKSIDISFKKEVQYGNQALAEVELDQDTLTSYHLISNQGEASALAEINWKEN
jgi:medium-chain acyl-[acyl-carrier-protein] hydrolase